MVVRPGIVSHSAVDSFVGIPRSFGAEFPYCPIVAVFGVEKGDELVERIAVCELGVCL